MGKSLEDKMAELPIERQQRILEGADRLQTLYQLRKAQDCTQAELAKKLNVSQVAIARLEKRSDLMLSTLRSYIEGLGGTLDLTVKFPNSESVTIKGFSDQEVQYKNK